LALTGFERKRLNGSLRGRKEGGFETKHTQNIKKRKATEGIGREVLIERGVPRDRRERESGPT
jgi:hypothetical protein